MYLGFAEHGDILEVGLVGFAVDCVDERFESLRSKLVPYGLLSSSFHIMRSSDSFRSSNNKGTRSLRYASGLYSYEAIK
jgi:hypothetical protein